MNYFLDIIVPEYNCKETDMNNLINSIIRQKNVNLREIKIIIVNDNSSKKYKKSFFRKYPQIDIEYYLKDVNEGVGMTRQFGLDKSTAKYVTFVDQDDELYGNDSLEKIISYLKTFDADLLLTPYVEEILGDDGNIVPVIHKGTDATEAVHGVFIKRKALIDQGVRFVPGIRYNDDYYFKRIICTLLLAHYIDATSYLWKYNYDSVVRQKRKYDYLVEHFDDYFKAIQYKIEFLKNKDNYINKNTFCSILSAFMILESNYFDYEELKGKKEYFEKELYKLICDNSLLIESVVDSFDEIYKIQYDAECFHMKDLKVNENYFDYISRMKIKYPEFIYQKYENRKILDIIIPYYNVEITTVMKFLESFFNQKGINYKEVGLYIIGDKSSTNIPSSYLENKFDLDIKFINKNERTGFGDTCQFGIDNSDADYFMILKQRDLFYDWFVLRDILNYIRGKEYDIVFANYVDKNDIEHSSYDEFNLDGVIINRKFVKKSNVRFDSKLFNYGYLEYAEQIKFKLKNISKYNRNVVKIQYLLHDEEKKDILNNYKEYINAKFKIGNYLEEPSALLENLFDIFILIESNLFEDVDISSYEEKIYNEYNKILSNYKEIDNLKTKTFKKSINSIVKEFKAREIRKSFDEFISEYENNSKK